MFGTAPATAKQIKYLGSLCRKLEYDSVNAYVIQFKGKSQTLSAKQASEAIAYALQRIGGKATRP